MAFGDYTFGLGPFGSDPEGAEDEIVRNPRQIFDQGDPKLFIDSDGVDIELVDGWPVMETGIENMAVISLFSDGPFAFNAVANGAIESAGSRFLAESRKSITVNQIKIIEDAAEKAFSPLIAEGIVKTVTASMEILNGIYALTILVSPPVGEDRKLLFKRSGQNWINQSQKG